MLGMTEFMLSLMVRVSTLADQGKTTIGQIGRAKAICTTMARDVVRMAREIFGGDGILL